MILICVFRRVVRRRIHGSPRVKRAGRASAVFGICRRRCLQNTTAPQISPDSLRYNVPGCNVARIKTEIQRTHPFQNRERMGHPNQIPVRRQTEIAQTWASTLRKAAILQTHCAARRRICSGGLYARQPLVLVLAVFVCRTSNATATATATPKTTAGGHKGRRYKNNGEVNRNTNGKDNGKNNGDRDAGLFDCGGLPPHSTQHRRRVREKISVANASPVHSLATAEDLAQPCSPFHRT